MIDLRHCQEKACIDHEWCHCECSPCQEACRAEQAVEAEDAPQFVVCKDCAVENPELHEFLRQALLMAGAKERKD